MDITATAGSWESNICCSDIEGRVVCTCAFIREHIQTDKLNTCLHTQYVNSYIWNCQPGELNANPLIPIPFFHEVSKLINARFMIFIFRKCKVCLNLKRETLCNSSFRYYFHRQPFHWCTFYVTEFVGSCDISFVGYTRHEFEEFWKYSSIEEVAL